MKTMTVTNRQAWRAWLEENHNQVDEIWLIYFKKESGEAGINYEESVEEAICYGWVDSLIKKIDDQRYARKFTPRTQDSQWSEPNKRRVKRMLDAGRMTEHGLRLVQAAKDSGRWDEQVKPPKLEFTIHPDFEQALQANPTAQDTFDNLAPSYQKQYTGWINHAKREQTRQKRIREAVRLLEKGQKLGLK